MNYLPKIENAWEGLKRVKNFNPQEELDIHAMFFHFLLRQGIEFNKIYNHLSIYLKKTKERRFHTDMLIGEVDKKGIVKKAEFIIEIKKFWKLGHGKKVISNDFKKLNHYIEAKKVREELKNTKFILAIFCIDGNTRKCEKYKNFIKEMEIKCDRKNLIFLHN